MIEQVSPGYYFQRCLRLWTRGNDQTRQAAPQQGANAWGIEREAKASAVKPLEGKPPTVRGEPDLAQALGTRQGAVFAMLSRRSAGAEWRLRSLTRFVTGIGSPHPLENGFAFLKPYGLPYLPASGVKGAVRAACRELWQGERKSEAAALLRHYFGSDTKVSRPGQPEEHQRGALVFFDLFPDLPKGSEESPYKLDIVNPHYGDYYERKSVPADWLTPVPSYFLALRDGLEWRLRVLYVPPVEKERRGPWLEDITPGVAYALTECGLGAKKSWGYGLFEMLSGPGTSAAGTGRHDTPRRSEAARSVDAILQGLRPRTVSSQIDTLQRSFSAADAGERAGLLDKIEVRLRDLGVEKKRHQEIMQRLRAVSGGQS